MSKMQMRRVVFAAPRVVCVEQSTIPTPAADEVLVETDRSAISAGSELLFYRGQASTDMPVDASISALADLGTHYPISYGYACAGSVVDVGSDQDESWIGRRVFAFHPHASHFATPARDVLLIPDDVSFARASLLPNLETALNFVMDGRPVIGERVAVFGLGVVGLLTTALLARFPLAKLHCIEPIDARRKLARSLGASEASHPEAFEAEDFDLVFELSGSPAVLNQALNVTGYSSRVVVGSWYGEKTAQLALGGLFHRNRIRLISSQVSTIDPFYSGRWTKARRFAVAWQMLAQLPLDGLFSHEYNVADAAQAYHLLDQAPEAAIQVLFSYQ